MTLAQQIDVVLQRLEQKLTLGLPPSRVAEIETQLDDAKILLVKSQPTSKDLEAAQVFISSAENNVDMLKQGDLKHVPKANTPDF